MGKAINALCNSQDELSKEENYKLTFKEFEPHVIPKRVKVQNPHERIVTEIREVTYLRDGFVREENATRKIVLETTGTEIVKEILVPRSQAESLRKQPRVMAEVIRDLRRKDDGNQN